MPGQQLNELCDGLPDGVVVADADERVVVANRQAERMLGVDVTGRRLRDLPLCDEVGSSWYAGVSPYAGISTRTGVPEQSWRTESGEEVLVTTRINRCGAGAPVSHVALVLRSARGRARLDRERSDLVATVAHELRSPLTGVKGFVGTLLNRWERLNDDQKRLMLTTVHRDAERLSRLITELLDVARLDTGRLRLHPRPVDLDEVVDRVLASARQATSRTLEHLRSGPAPVRVVADPDKLVQVVTNLVDNAVRHGEGIVTVSTGSTGTSAWLRVDDEGEGIPEQLRSRVSTKFWRYGERGGSGLGMYIVNGLVQAHGGSMAITDAPGGGARIVVEWPALS